MNEEIISTLIQSVLIIIFLTSFFAIISNHVKLYSAYYSHAKSLQTINKIIMSGKNFEEYCNYIFTHDVSAVIRKGSETCQTRSNNYYSTKNEMLVTSLPVLNNNEIVWVGSYA